MGTPQILDEEVQERQLGGIVRKRRSLEALEPLEVYVQDRAPLPITYDVNRPQPWYFTEFTYTEFMGGLAVFPMCDELAVRLVRASMGRQSEFSVDTVLLQRQKTEFTLDKYGCNLGDFRMPFDQVVILPGSNVLMTQVSRELLARAVWENPGLAIKPHPLTNAEDLRMLGREFGRNRLLPALCSGYKAVTQAKVVWATGTTELAGYAAWLGKPIKSVTNVFYERGASYYPLFHFIAGKGGLTARKQLLRILQSETPCVVFPEDPDWKVKLDRFFAAAMRLRERYKPLVFNSQFPVPVDPRSRKETEGGDHGKHGEAR